MQSKVLLAVAKRFIMPPSSSSSAASAALSALAQSKILIQMDNSQADHLKAYGIADAQRACHSREVQRSLEGTIGIP